MLRFTLCLSALLLFATTPLLAEEKKVADAEKPEEKVTFVDHVLPIFRARCGSCHNASDRRGGLVVDQYGPLMEGGSSGSVIEAGDASISYLFLLVNHEDTPQMPPNADKIPENELAIIQKWIDLGALENAGSKANIKPKKSLAKIEVSNERPADIAMPLAYLGEPLHKLQSRNSVTALATSPWAPLIAVSGFQQVGLYHAETLEPLGTLAYPEGQPQVLKFSRNGDLLLVGGGRGGQSGRVVVYDVKTGERSIEVGDEYDEVLAADISPDQSLIALGGPKKMLRVYSSATGELLYENKKHTDWVTAIEFSPDGVLLASGDRSNGLVVWEADSGKMFYDLQGHQGTITEISWRADSNLMGSSSEDGTVKLWDMNNGNQAKSWNAHGGGAMSLKYTREGNVVTVGRNKVTTLWNGDGGKIRDFSGLADIGMEVAYCAESKRVMAGDWSGIVQIWNSENAEKIGEIDTNPPSIDQVLAIVEPQLQQAREVAAAKADVFAKLNNSLTERKQAAEQAQVQVKQMEGEVEKLKSQKAKGSEEVATVMKQLETLNTQVTAAKVESEKAQAEATRLQGIANADLKQLEVHNAKLKQVQSAAQSASEGVAKATETHQLAIEAAQPSADEESLMATDAAVKAVIEKRREVAKATEAALTIAKLVQNQAAEQFQVTQQTQAALQTVAQKSGAAAQTATESAKQSAATYAQLMKQQSDATQALATANEALKKLTEAETAAVAKLGEMQANAKKLTEAAQPTDDEQKALQAAQQAAQESQAALKALEERVKKVKDFKAQVASATAQAG